jgi:hypothetical protein
MAKLTSVTPMDGYRLSVEFDDGTSGEIDLSDRLFGPVFEPLHEVDEFKSVFIDEFGAVAWPCGADLAPDGIYYRLTSGVPA